MAYVDTPFPERIGFGMQVGPSWSTDLAATLSGFEQTNQNWAQARHRYEVGLVVRPVSEFALIRAHFHTMRGRAKTFPFKDPLDYRATTAEGYPSAVGDTFKLVKRYGSGDDAYDRKISRPSTYRVYRTRSSVTTDATADISLDSDGFILMANHVGGDTYRWAGQFFVPCRYDIDKLQAVIPNKQPGQQGELYVECPSIPIIEVRE